MTPSEFRHIRRDVLRLTQAELAEILGISKFTVINIERADTVKPVYALAILGTIGKVASDMTEQARSIRAAHRS